MKPFSGGEGGVDSTGIIIVLRCQCVRLALLAGFIFMQIESPNYAIAKVIDLRNQSDIVGDYELGFCARPSPDTLKQLPGHAFVAYSHVPSKGERTFRAVGHTVSPGVSPGSAAWSYFGKPVAGYLKEEQYTSSMERCLRVKVNKTDYEAAYALTVTALQAMGMQGAADVPVFQAYKLGANDCMNFVINVAEVLKGKGLTVPQRGSAELPTNYIERLIQSN